MKGGKHFIIDLNNVTEIGNCEKDKLYDLCDSLCKIFGFTVLHKYHHEFTPQGVTLFYLLAESHISIHTFPEEKYISMDIYTCKYNKRFKRNTLKTLLEIWFECEVNMRLINRN